MNSCEPGHTDGDPACKQIRNDRDVRTRFDPLKADFVTTFEYPCGWTIAQNRTDDHVQANVTRADIGEEGAYVDVQVRNYDDPVEDGFLDSKKEEGDYDEVDYQYDGETRTGLVSSSETAQFGTTAHAVVPSNGGDSLIHVEFSSTLKGADCAQPQPDYLLVKKMFKSIQPNGPEAAVTIADQRVSGEVETQAVTVSSVTLSDGGFVSISTGSIENGIDGIIGASSMLSSGTHQNIRIALDETLTETQTITAVAHFDTDGDNIYEFGSSQGVDVPYTDQSGNPVSDGASIEVMVDTPIPTTTTPTPTATPTPTPTPTPTSTPTPTPAQTEAPTTRSDSSSQTTVSTETAGGAGPGFGVGAALGALGLAGVRSLRQRFRNRDE